MAGKRLKVEFDDGEGGRYTLSLAGALNKEKVLKVMDIVNLFGAKDEEPESPASNDTMFGKLYTLVEKSFPIGSFSSADVLEAYEDEYREPIRLSTMSTYLSRFHTRGLLTRQRSSTGWLYRKARLTQLQK